MVVNGSDQCWMFQIQLIMIFWGSGHVYLFCSCEFILLSSICAVWVYMISKGPFYPWALFSVFAFMPGDFFHGCFFPSSSVTLLHISQLSLSTAVLNELFIYLMSIIQWNHPNQLLSALSSSMNQTSENKQDIIIVLHRFKNDFSLYFQSMVYMHKSQVRIWQ